MDVAKPYEFIGFGAMDVARPYEFIGLGAMDVAKTLNVGALRAPMKIYFFVILGGPKSPQKPLPGARNRPLWAQKRGPRAIPNDPRVGQNSENKNNK